ncbi:MAG: TRAP transporter fused permease subunit, partial [Deltaproteobacteria bacterium]|nr:TRAP transporter fused permease subunit [Deltaproteobacteria bacterium]
FNLIILIWCLYLLITAVRPVHPIPQAALCMGFALVLCFALLPATKKKSPRIRPSLLDWFCMILSISACGYMVIRYEFFLLRPAFSTPAAIVLGTVLLVLILESARRTIGAVIPLITIVFILYAYFGDYIPGTLGHGGFSHTRIVEFLYLGTRGYWGTITRILALNIPVFVIFGAMLLATGGAEVFTNVSKLIAGRFSGGAATIALVASAIFGMLSGSSVSNLATTGAFTIPMMKRLGYRKEFAGAVEAVASTGGQFMPPVMGAGAFIMAELVGIPYIKICFAAAIPALLFFLGAGISIYLEASRAKMGRIPIGMMPKVKEVLSLPKLASVIIPVGILFYFLLKFYTPRFAAFWALISVIALYLPGYPWNMNEVKRRYHTIVEGFIAGARGLVGLLCVGLCVQIIVSLIGLTGVGIKMTSMIIDLSKDHLLPALLLSGAVALILGMGLPTSAAYILGAAVLGAALINMGIDPLAAHLFIFYYAISSVITPPMCPAIYIASGIAESNWKKTAVIACRLAMPAYIVPFMFVINPALIGRGSGPFIILSAITAIIGVFSMCAGIIGHLKRRVSLPERLLFIIAGIILIKPGLLSDGIGCGLFIVGIIIQRYIHGVE